MQLLPLTSPELIDLAAGWLSEKRNYQWLDFGNGVQKLDSLALKIMLRKDAHLIRAFTDEGNRPIGVVGLSSIDRKFKTASLWIALGEKQYSKKGYALLAVHMALELAFKELGLAAVNVWAVECNHASLRIMKYFDFKPIGRQRKCHYIDDRAYDRLWFDLLSSEFKGLNND